MDIDSRSLASPTTPSSTFFLPIAFLSPNFLSLTLQSRPVLYLIPQFLEALKPRSPYPHCPTWWRYQRLSKTLCLTLYPTNHSASTLMNEALYWYSSSSIRTDISNRQPSVSVDLHYSLDDAELGPFEPESRAKTERFGPCFLKVHVQKSRFSCSNSGIMPYDQDLSTAVVTGSLSREIKGLLVNRTPTASTKRFTSGNFEFQCEKCSIDVLEYLENTLDINIIDVMIE